MATIEERLERLERLQEENARGIKWATQVAERLATPEARERMERIERHGKAA